eukprot:TRINITY_DN93075_c0_g1_i1.p1 TRINITY_DN93075_c0_g1~~TRINITY_DN93075_c0_g1_i1.p1  ORF type:complete len:446 (-),score=94.96 TRINITY_DN93075_c0_g1_i1:111-1448(-)
MSADSSRALQVIRGSPAKSSTVLLPKVEPGAEEVLVQVQATALTAADVLLCNRAAIPMPSGARGFQAACFVPGIFFTGKVLAFGAFVHGLVAGETVLGITGPLPEELDSKDVKEAQGSGSFGGCFRETVCVHFSSLLPVSALVEAKLQLPVLVAHVPPMVSALTCVASHLRLRPFEALLIITPRLGDVAFLLQRLLLISGAWQGPLYLLVLHGPVPERADIERHALLQPLGGSQGFQTTFLEGMFGYSAEERVQGSVGQSFLTKQAQAAAVRELVAEISSHTGGLGLDVILALDLELGPEEQLQTSEQNDLDAACKALEPVRQQPTLLRTMLGALALRGRFVTNCDRLEMSPADGEHLWAKECCMSFWNPHCLPLSASRHGELLHATTEVCGRLAAGELVLADSDVVQYRLFDQFQQALDAMSNSSKVYKQKDSFSHNQLVSLIL